MVIGRSLSAGRMALFGQPRSHYTARLARSQPHGSRSVSGARRCRRPNGSGGVYENKDILDWPSGRASGIRDADGTWPSRSGVLETGARWNMNLWISPQNGDCQAQINAVLFSDGGFEGEDAAVRGLKAHRDGLAAAVNYWAARISREKPDGSTLDALLYELKQHVAGDQMKQKKYWVNINEDTQPLFWQYWSGWLQVESNIELRLPKELSQEKAGENFRKVADQINRWKTNIDGNLALQKLNVVFPATIRQ